FGTALAPPLVGLISDLTSLLAAFYIVTPPIAVGALILLKARDTIEEDARAIIGAYMQQTQAGQDGASVSGGPPADGASPLPDSQVVASDRVQTQPAAEETEPSPT
ncbi:MAG: hypothetical protein ACRD1T_23975, partial [Acidimicrobiia bacterium]